MPAPGPRGPGWTVALQAALVVLIFALPYVACWMSEKTIIPAAIATCDSEPFYAARTRACLSKGGNPEYAILMQDTWAPPLLPFAAEMILALAAWILGGVTRAFVAADLLIPALCFLVARSELSRELGGRAASVGAWAMVLAPAILHGPNLIRYLLDAPLYAGLGGGLLLQRTVQPQFGLLLLLLWTRWMRRAIDEPERRGPLVIAMGLLAAIPWTSFHFATAAAGAAALLGLGLLTRGRRPDPHFLVACLPAAASWLLFLARSAALHRAIDPALLRALHIDENIPTVLDRYDYLTACFHAATFLVFRRTLAQKPVLSLWLGLAVAVDLLVLQGLVLPFQVQPFHWRVYVRDLADVALAAAWFDAAARQATTSDRLVPPRLLRVFEAFARGYAIRPACAAIIAMIVATDALLLQYLQVRQLASEWHTLAGTIHALDQVEPRIGRRDTEFFGHDKTMAFASAVVGLHAFTHESTLWGTLEAGEVLRRQAAYHSIFALPGARPDSQTATGRLQELLEESRIGWVHWGPLEREWSTADPASLPNLEPVHGSATHTLFRVTRPDAR